MKNLLTPRHSVGLTALIFLGGWQLAGAATDFDYVTIYRAKPGQSAMYAVFTPLENGELLCTFRSSTKDEKGNPWNIPGSRIVCIRSADGGRTWSKEPVFVYQDKDSAAYTALGFGYQADDGTILVPFYVCNATGDRYGKYGEGQAMRRHWNFMAKSTDCGRTWWCRNLPSGPFFSNPQYGSILRPNDGSLWMVERCRGYQIDYTKAKAGEMTRAAVRIMRSVDEGASWSLLSYVGYDPTRPKKTESFPEDFKEDEPGVIQLPSGKIIVMARPNLLEAVSLDGGRTWKIRPSNLSRKGEHAGLCPMMCHSKSGPPGGTLMLTYHDRWGEHARQGGLYISFSHDEGETWGHPTRIDGGAYGTPYEIQPGKILCGYYRSSSLLMGAFFSVPFPTGIRAATGLDNSDGPGVTVAWDAYRGKDSETYEYRVHRSTSPEFPLNDSTHVFSGKDVSCYVDKTVTPGQTYYYRVAAFSGDRPVGRSWSASCAYPSPQPSP